VAEALNATFSPFTPLVTSVYAAGATRSSPAATVHCTLFTPATLSSVAVIASPAVAW
jgi:phage terminase large subunit-like protein